ncbi:hypothetical protein CC1G_11765 [Coprinopsis cinerea okayama7|uniref:Uncharacterized protein n=1 Tax=Coprinopsis cinerea (strain Okayama-7 / 130 / ATCC MYA-4618 / FGSC 9003) TaxID=240176 RepID=A8NGM6_COPC7|nr:hypothetical protein CC1G_11765 [Coprinopsis cinerea okayama7\|eukprot:XP_001833559.2 hypothetical protein CC1G_11765 [Coprinopsis cinerea okayama7\
MDRVYNFQTDIYAFRACHNDDAQDLVAIGGLHSVEVLQLNKTEVKPIASFHLGSRVTSIAWSSSTVSPSKSDSWSLELAVATDDYGLHLLTKSSTDREYVFPFGGGLSGHHGIINDMTFCGGWTEDSSRYVATVSDDKMLMVWDLRPPKIPNVNTTHDEDEDDMSPPPRPQPTALVIPFPHPLVSISSHPLTSKEFLVSDCRGSVFMTDWRLDSADLEMQSNFRHSNLVELVDPAALAAACVGQSQRWTGSVGWRSDSLDIVGGVFGNRFAIWDLANLRGGKPVVTSQGVIDGGHKFRWCKTYPEHFAVSTQIPTKGAVIQVYNLNFPHAQPTVFTLRPKPQFVRDFDFLSVKGIPQIAAVIGKTVFVFAIGEES